MVAPISVVEDAGKPGPIERADMSSPAANPREIAAGDEESAVRRTECHTYKFCLDVAAKARWASWSCDACDAFTPRPRDDLVIRRGSPLSFDG